jgi:hypothetical protein
MCLRLPETYGGKGIHGACLFVPEINQLAERFRNHPPSTIADPACTVVRRGSEDTHTKAKRIVS